MNEPTPSTPPTTPLAARSWLNIVVPLVPIALAILAAAIVSRYAPAGRSAAPVNHSSVDAGSKAPDFTLHSATMSGHQDTSTNSWMYDDATISLSEIKKPTL